MEKGEYSIEHIMPQSLSESWKIDLGDDWESIHETWKNRLGNLTVVATPYNSMFSNNSFARKRDMEHGFRDSGLRINQSIAAKEKWGEKELEERAAALAAKSLTIWPDLVTTYEEAEEDTTEITLDDDIDLLGRNLISAFFNGIPINTTVWADFLETVCKFVCDSDPVGLAAVTKDSSRYNLDSFLSTTAVEQARKITESIWLRTDRDNNRKLWFLRHLFSALNLDEDSLVIRVGSSDRFEADIDATKRLWSHIIPKLIEATKEAGCPSYQKRNPVGSYYLDGYIGCSQMHLVSSFGVNYPHLR